MQRAGRAMFHVFVAAMLAISAAGFAKGQTPGPAAPQDTADVLKALDQVIEQNRKLEQRNRELMDQVNALRQKFATAPTPPAPTATPDKQEAEAPLQDARNTLPQASDGSPSVFGEFNP